MMIPKMRMWDEERKQMCDLVPHYQVYESLKVDKNIIRKGQFPDTFHVMQSTGIKDKNGIEIYEGDVVKVNKRISNKRLIGVVEYCGAAFRVRGVKQYLGSEDELIEDVRELKNQLDRIESFVDFKILSNPSSGQYIGIKHYIDKVRRGRDED